MLQGKPVYQPWPMFTWMATPLYNQDHQYSGEQDVFYCGRTIWPNEDWWMNNYMRLGLEHTYWVVETVRAGNKCGTCSTMSGIHLKMPYEQQIRGYWTLPDPSWIQTVSLDALPRVAKMLSEIGATE